MAWIYLAESVDSPSPWNRGSGQSPTVKTTDTLKLLFCRVCDAVICQSPQYGTMCAVFEGHRCPQKLISSTADFHARTLALRELEAAWMATEVDCFLKSFASLAKLNPDTFSWKTSQQSLFGGLTEFAWSSLRWGMIVAGQLFQPQKWVPSIFVNDGSYLPTPTACDYGKNVGRKSDGITPSGRDRWSLTVRARRGELPGHPKGSLNPSWVELAMGYPVEWTAIEDWAMPLFLAKRAKRLKDCAA